MNNCFSIYHTSWITSGLKSNFIFDNTPTKAILFFFGWSEVNSTWLITSELANQCARKVLFTCVVYTNIYYFTSFFSVPIGLRTYSCKLTFNSKWKYGKLAVVVHVLQNMQNLLLCKGRQRNVQRFITKISKNCTTTEIINWAVSVYDEKLHFRKNSQVTLTRSAVKLACIVMTAPIISPNWTSISYRTSNQLKACSCARVEQMGQSCCKRVKALNNCSFFQLQLSISHFYPQALSSFFRDFHRKSTRFHEPQCRQGPLDLQPLPARLIKCVQLLKK